MARPPATAPAKKKHKQSGGVFGTQYKPTFGHPESLLPGWTFGPKGGGNAVKSFWKTVIADPIAGDFKRNRGKVIIGIVAGVVLLGGGFKLINGATGGGITKGALTIAAPEIEAASVVKQGLKQRTTRRLHAREPIAPMRYAMRKANP